MTYPRHIWSVPATVVRVVDGDTLELDLNLGWHITLRARCRLASVNAPEMSTAAGVAARDWVAAWLASMPLTAPSTFISHSLDKYRPLGQLIVYTHDLGTELLASGHAVPM